TLFVFPNDAFGLSEEHFSEPEKFEPHHFSEEEKKNRSVYSYLHLDKAQGTALECDLLYFKSRHVSTGNMILPNKENERKAKRPRSIYI
ncbi:Cytochrome P450 9a20, partial [Caligus rogercresseyi]